MRLFIAVNLSPDVRQGLWDAAADFRETGAPVRWVDRDALHITVKFLGNVGEEREPAIRDALRESVRGAKRFTLPVAGFGAFPTIERPRVIWAGCDGVPPLELLQDRVERCMHGLGFAVAGRPFRPHVTLGRVKDGARPRELAPLGARLTGAEFSASCTITSLDLMASHASPEGSRYSIRHAVSLTA